MKSYDILWDFYTADAKRARLVVGQYADGENAVALQKQETQRKSHECSKCGKVHGERRTFETVGKVSVRDGTPIPTEFTRVTFNR